MKCYLFSEPELRSYRKRILSLRLNKGMFWVSQQRLVYRTNTTSRNSWIAELELEELERNLAENYSYHDEERSADDTCNNLGEEVRYILVALEADWEVLAILRKKRLPLLKK